MGKWEESPETQAGLRFTLPTQMGSLAEGGADLDQAAAGPHQRTADTLVAWTALQETLESITEGLKTPERRAHGRAV